MAKKIPNLNNLAAGVLYLLAFLLPLQTRWIAVDSAIQFHQISLYGFDILAVILICLSFIAKGGNDDGLSRRSLIALLGLITIWSVIGLFWSADPRLSSYWILRLITILGVIWSVKSIKFDTKALAWSFTIAVFLQALLGIGQFLYQDDIITSKWLGAAAQQSSSLGTSVIESSASPLPGSLGWDEPGRWLRAHGTQPHPNVLGGLILVGLAFAFYLRTEGYKRLGFIRKTPAPFAAWLNIIMLVMAAGLFFTFSRSAWLVALLLFLSQITRHRLRFVNTEIRVLLPGLLLFVILAVTYHPLLISRLGLAPRLEQISVTERLSQIEQAQSVFRSNLATGAGIGNYTYSLREIYPGLPAYQIQPVHNTYLLILSEIGIFGLLIMLMIIYQTIRQYSGKNVIFFSLYIGLLIIGLFDHYIWTLPSFVYIFWLLNGLVFYRRLQ